jgi:hypothetical protein
MAITRPLVNIIVLLIYIAIFIPLILPHLLNMFIDFVNNSDMFNIQYCSTRVLQSENETSYIQLVECTQEDLRPFIIFIFQLVVYFLIPLVIVFRAFRR